MKGSHATARRRAEMIIKVQSGQMTASEAANRLGVSRKTYYKWEERALEALLVAVSDRSAGRPAHPVDTEKEAMERSMAEMERQMLLAEQRAEIRDYFITDTERKQMEKAWALIQKKKRETGNDRGPDGKSEDS